MNIQELEKLKRWIDQLREAKAKAAGRRERALSDLQQQFQCNDLDEAKKKLKELEEQCQRENVRLTKELMAFEEKLSQ